MSRHTQRRGAMLLELMLCIALLVTLGIAILDALSHASDSLRQERDDAVAADLARSAMAKLEAGLATAETLDGPAETWEEQQAGGAFEDSPPDPNKAWYLDVQTEPTGFDGLTLVAVTAYRSRDGSPLETTGSSPRFTLRQLVRLGSQPVDDVTDGTSSHDGASRLGERLRGAGVASTEEQP
ncbi:MAG: hypothetical protein H7Y88_11390 [Phycisphaerales bacterium]|nr:hypothetical protein [Phycisphaerales bacterium]